MCILSCTMNITLGKLHYAYCTMHIALCTLHYAHFTMHIVICTLCFAHCDLHIALCILPKAHCTLQYANGMDKDLICIWWKHKIKLVIFGLKGALAKRAFISITGNEWI